MMNHTFDQSFAFFEDAPELDLEISFDAALDRAVTDENDLQAFTMLTSHLERARDKGDLTRLYEMSMVIGATACMHDHMQQFSSGIDMFSPSGIEQNNDAKSHDGHNHGTEGHKEDDDEYEIDPITGKKVKKRRHIFS